MDKTVLVTGGNGYIGSEIVKKLVLNGVKPYLLLRTDSNKDKISESLSTCEVIECDITQSSKVDHALGSIKPHIVLHFASTGVHTYTDEGGKNRNLIIDTNIKGTVNLLIAASQHGCKTFINTGSCFEYGSSNEPFTEEDVCHPANLYGTTKLTATLLCQMFAKNHRLPTVTIRPFTVYGPHEGPGRFICTMITRCLNKQDLPIVKETIVRDYVYIDDVVDGYFSAIEFRDTLIGEIINISSGRGSTLIEVARLIKKMTGALDVPIKPGLFPTRPGEVLSLVGSNKKAKKIMGWQAKYTLPEGLRKTISLLTNNLSNN